MFNLLLLVNRFILTKLLTKRNINNVGKRQILEGFGLNKMLEIKSQELFDKIVSDAIESAVTNSKSEFTAKRWERAIDRAVSEIQENPYLHYDAQAAHLVICSSSSNKIYSANGVCQCKAYTEGIARTGKPFACWHRAAARIWRLYLEAENKPLPPVAAAAAFACAA